MATLLKSCRLHKKGLGFVAPQAASLVKKEEVLQCKQRFFALINPNKDGQPWQMRYSKIEPEDESSLLVSMDEIASDPLQPIKGVIILDGTTQISTVNDVISICTKERTFLLTAGPDDVMRALEMIAMVDSYILSRKQLEQSFVASAAEVRRTSLLPQAVTTAAVIRRASAAPQPRPSAFGRAISPIATENDNAVTRPPIPDAEMSLESVLADSALRARFRNFVKSAFAVENLDFYEAVEKHLTIPETDAAALRQSARRIVESYVKENSPEQVNLSYNQSRSLLDAVAAEDLANAEGGDVLLCLLQCQHEIQELLRRNFFFRFATMLEQEHRRQQLLETTQGCFTNLYQKTGVDAFITIFERFTSMQKDSKVLLTFVQLRMDTGKAYMTASLIPSATESKKQVFSAPSLKSTSAAISSVLDVFDLHAKTTADYLLEMQECVLGPLKLMVENVDFTLGQFRRTLQSKVDDIITSRERSIRMGNAEVSAKAQIVTMSTKLAELESQGKKKEKELKKMMAQFDKLRLDSIEFERGRSDAELDCVMKESDASEEFLSALLQLESLALYRLDTIKDCLGSLIFAEQTALARLGLKFQGTLNDCSKVDSIRDLIALSEEADDDSVRRRHQSVSPAAIHSGRDPVIHEAVLEEDVPVAEVVTTGRRRWL